MSLFFSALGLLLAVLMLGVAFYLITARRYQSSNSVANSYDQWTFDGILEFYWGEHIHLGHSGRIVPEFETEQIREVIEGSYRIIYYIKPEQIDVLAVIHGSLEITQR